MTSTSPRRCIWSAPPNTKPTGRSCTSSRQRLSNVPLDSLVFVWIRGSESPSHYTSTWPPWSLWPSLLWLLSLQTVFLLRQHGTQRCTSFRFWGESSVTNNDQPRGTCQDKISLQTVSYIVSVIQMVTDWACAIIPFFIVAGLQMSRRRKVSVIAILGIGVTASIATCIRMPFLKYYDTKKYPTEIGCTSCTHFNILILC